MVVNISRGYFSWSIFLCAPSLCGDIVSRFCVNFVYKNVSEAIIECLNYCWILLSLIEETSSQITKSNYNFFFAYNKLTIVHSIQYQTNENDVS